MVKHILSLYSAGTTTADAVASLVVPRSGRVTAISFGVYQLQGGGGGGEFSFELSAQSTSQFAVSEAQGRLGVCKSGTYISGAVSSNVILQTGGIPVEAGQRIYLHRLSNANISAGNIVVQIYIE